MRKKGIDLQSLRDVVDFWQYHIGRLSQENEEEVAGSMTNVVANDNWDHWYNESRGDPYFVEIFDLVADLETPSTDLKIRQDKWRRVKGLLNEMEAKQK